LGWIDVRIGGGSGTQSEEQQAHEEPVALAVSVDDFSALEERVRRAVEMVKRERQARAAAEARVAELEAHATDPRLARRSRGAASGAGSRATQLKSKQTQLPVVEQLQSELSALRAERDQVRQRVERLLAQLDTLEL
jgi:hypothetical protein